MAKRNAHLKALGQRIARLRHERGLKQEAVAHEAGIATKTLSEIERGLGNATTLTLIEIAKAMKVSPKEFFPEPDTLQVRDSGAREDDRELAERIVQLLREAGRSAT